MCSSPAVEHGKPRNLPSAILLRVVGIDISPTSLKHTAALKQKYDLNNLETRELAIEKVNDLDRQFDLIISTGVLHHLADPDVGLRALRSLLQPEGAMYLMLYAPYGRTGVHMLQEYCRKVGIGTSPQETHDLTIALKELPPHHHWWEWCAAREMPSTLVRWLVHC